MKTEPNDPISAIIESDYNCESQLTAMNASCYGLTKREYFAGLAMASFFGGEYIGQSGLPNEMIAERCVSMADALINQLNKL